MPFTVSLDYDRTYTLDPPLWNQFVSDARARGHTVICVTQRHRPPEPPELVFPGVVVCAGNDYKRHAAAKAGYHVHVWIDDMPELIAPSLVLDLTDVP